MTATAKIADKVSVLLSFVCARLNGVSLKILSLTKFLRILQDNDVNDLPIVYNISWYEQKAVIVLLALLYLGVKNIHLGPTLPAFLSPNVAKVLVDSFGIAGITTVDEDMRIFGL